MGGWLWAGATWVAQSLWAPLVSPSLRGPSTPPVRVGFLLLLMFTLRNASSQLACESSCFEMLVSLVEGSLLLLLLLCCELGHCLGKCVAHSQLDSIVEVLLDHGFLGCSLLWWGVAFEWRSAHRCLRCLVLDDVGLAIGDVHGLLVWI